MILQYIQKTEETVEVVRDNATDVYEFDDRVEVTFSRPNGELNLVKFEKEHPTISDMWLLNDNFKTLKRLI